MKRASVNQHGGAMVGLLVALCATAAVGCVEEPVGGLTPKQEEEQGPVTCAGKPCDQEAPPEQEYTGSEEETYDHMGDLSPNAKDPFAILADRQSEGPPEIRSRMHSCQKLQNTTLRNVLSSLGVNIDANGDPPTAGQLYRGGTGALGAANYDSRVSEAISWSAAGAAKLFDIFVQAAPEIIANVSTVPQCQVGGVGPEMFNANNECNADALSCIIGRPATQEHVALCNSIVQSATDVDKGKNIAVGTILAANHSCE